MDFGRALISLVFGALAGGFVSLGGIWYWRRQTRKAAGRALLAELFTNLERTMSADTTSAGHDPGDTVWRTQMPLISKLLVWSKLKTVLRAYDAGFRLLDNIREIENERGNHAAAGNPQTVEVVDRSRKRYQTIEAWYVRTAEDWLGAIDTVQALVLRKRERREFDRDLERLKETLSSYRK